MIKKNLKMIVILASLITLLVVTSCAPARPVIKVGELQTRSESVKLDGAKSESVEIGFGAGELNVSGGADDLLQAKFIYNIDQFNPHVDYKAGKHNITMPDIARAPISLFNVGDYRYQWDLQLNDRVPMKMHVVMGAGSANLKLGSLSLTRFDLDAGAGPVTVDLTGDWQADLNATIKGGLGDITLVLPSNTCVRVAVERGLGGLDTQGLVKDGDEYVNGACGTSPATLHIHIGAGVGPIILQEG